MTIIGDILMRLLNKKILFMFIFLLGIYFYLPVTVFARAGGGGMGTGGGTIGGILTIILLPIMVIYLIILSWYLSQRNKQAKELANKIEKQDPNWNEEKIKNEVERAFYKVQEAWMNRDQDIAKDYMSESLYYSHKAQTDALLRANRKNILDNIYLKDVKLVEIEDFNDDTKDSFWVYITGSMIDYIVNDKTGAVISGNPNKAGKFSELWKFTRGSQRWVLDKIESLDILTTLIKFKSFSEEDVPTLGDGYLVCDKCGGYYRLQEGESLNDFDTCQCGGNLMYYNNIDTFFEEYNNIMGGNKKIRTKIYKSTDSDDLNLKN